MITFLVSRFLGFAVFSFWNLFSFSFLLVLVFYSEDEFLLLIVQLFSGIWFGYGSTSIGVK